MIQESGTRIEHDSIGELEVPAGVYYGIQTARAQNNFPISGITCHKEFIVATAIVKKGSALANMECGKLDKDIGGLIVDVADEIISGRLHDQFIVDSIQAGAGTSHNMNCNEVIANRAAEITGGRLGEYAKIHPNDHVNMSQSTNDVCPTALKIAAIILLEKLYPVLEEFAGALASKGEEFDHIIKSGRTHLQDAVPVRLGQEFHAYSTAVRKSVARIRDAEQYIHYLGIGGSAAGTGMNTASGYKDIVVEKLNNITGYNLKKSPDTFEAMQSMGDLAAVSAALRSFAIELTRIANDLRLLSSGPRTGFGEINLPPVQPGSSIMPGKVNPVMAEAMNMLAYQVMGHDAAVAMGTQAGQMELNVMMPLINYNLLQSLFILKNGISLFTEKCIRGISANENRCRELFETSVGLATVLNQHIGYEAAARIAKESVRDNKSMREVILKHKLLDLDEINAIFKPENIT